MKRLFIPAEAEVDIIPVVEKALKKLPQKIGLLTTAQHLGKLKLAKDFLEKNRKNVFVGGQVLGCNQANAEKIAEKVDCFLFIGSGEFHPAGVLLKTGKRIIVANPYSGDVSEISEADIEKIKKRKKGALLKFHEAKNIGILVSTKPGQQNIEEAEKLRKKYGEKKFYLFVADTFDFNELENFPFIGCWVNTACPRIAEEQAKKPIVNLEDL